MRPETLAKLKDGITVVEGLLASIGEAPSFSEENWSERFKTFRQAEDEVIGLLVRVHGATHGRDSSGERLRFAGVQTTCTSGPSGLMRNWIKAALRRLEKGA